MQYHFVIVFLIAWFFTVKPVSAQPWVATKSEFSNLSSDQKIRFPTSPLTDDVRIVIVRDSATSNSAQAHILRKSESTIALNIEFGAKSIVWADLPNLDPRPALDYPRLLPISQWGPPGGAGQIALLLRLNRIQERLSSLPNGQVSEISLYSNFTVFLGKDLASDIGAKFQLKQAWFDWNDRTSSRTLFVEKLSSSLLNSANELFAKAIVPLANDHGKTSVVSLGLDDDGIVSFSDATSFNTFTPGGTIVSEPFKPVASVSYTHLTLPTKA